MKKLAVMILVGMLAVTPLALASAGLGGSKGCDAQSWGCTPWDACYNKVPANQYFKFPVGSPERIASEESYKDCAKTAFAQCMINKLCKDYKKYHPEWYGA